MIANRLKEAVSRLISLDQNASIQERRIQDVILLDHEMTRELTTRVALRKILSQGGSQESIRQ